MAGERGISKTQIIAALAQSPHGKLHEYWPVAVPAAAEDPEFYGHLVAWTAAHSEVKDARVALPVIALASAAPADPFGENAAAHMASLDPRLFLRAVDFGRQMHGVAWRTAGFGALRNRDGLGAVVRRLVARYLADLERKHPAEWTRIVLQHWKPLRRLYTVYHVKASDLARRVIIERVVPPGSVFDVVRRLGTMEAIAAAGAIAKHKIPFLIAQGALKDRIKSPDVVLALIAQMSPTELVTNMSMLEKMGVTKTPALRAALDAALEKAGTSRKRKATLKTTTAAKQVSDAGISAKLKALQERQLARLSIEGNWLVLADKSLSMERAVKLAVEIAALLARLAKGEVHLLLFDETPRHIEATGKTLDELHDATRYVVASGNTSIGCGMLWALERKVKVDGIAVVSDGGENRHPIFAPYYAKYAEAFDCLPPVYFYKVPGTTPDVFTGNCQKVGVDVQMFDLRGSIDSYSLPTLVQTMRTGRYGMIEDVMQAPLKTVNDVLSRTPHMEVFRNVTESAERVQV